MRRLRVTYAKSEEIAYISHLDLVRAWERLLRRAGVPLAYSKGFNPHPRLSIAAPLPVGITGEAELMDVVLDGEVGPVRFCEMVEPQLPPGLRVVDVVEAPLDEPSLQSRLSFAEYSADLATPFDREEIGGRVAALMAADKIERQRRRFKGSHGSRSRPGGKVQTYDLRSVVDDIWLEEPGAGPTVPGAGSLAQVRLVLRLRVGPGGDDGGASGQEAHTGIGRPSDVLEALGLAQYAERVRRVRLLVTNPA